MKALTLTQPWAQLMADGRKHYETRGWKPGGLRSGELLAIHAAKGWQAPDRDCAESCGYEPGELVRGAVVAVVRLIDVVRTEDANPSEDEFLFGDYSPGRYAWRTELVAKLQTPVPYRGALGIWWLPDRLLPVGSVP